MIEYKVRPVGRYIVTRWSDDTAGSTNMGEFPGQDLASTVARALAATEPGATCSTNVLPMDAPAADLLRNIAEQFAGRAADGLVILRDHDDTVSVFGLGPVNATRPLDLIGMGKAKLAELWVK